jgi:GTP-binding protein EngB required for normal cell division
MTPVPTEQDYRSRPAEEKFREVGTVSQTDAPEDEIAASSQHKVLALVAELAQRYQINAIQPFLESCRSALERADLSIGVLGRFKAGKSSFLNHLIGRELLPVGVIPVTAVVTDLSGGETDSAEVQFRDGTHLRIRVNEIRQYVSETENPDNVKGAVAVSARVPELSRFRGIRLFDTPGLESAFAHNTEASLGWAPNVDIALVAIAVDPPLSQQDLALIRKLLDYTPRVAILLTKFDLLSQPEQNQVLEFVKTQLARNIGEAIEVYPYSTRAGYEHLRTAFATDFIDRFRAQIVEQRAVIANRKIATLVRECGDYMRLTLKSTEMIESEKSHLRDRAARESGALADTKLELRLIARHAMAGCRRVIESALSKEEVAVRTEVRHALAEAAPSFPKDFARLIEAFEQWLETVLLARLEILSQANRSEFLRPLLDVQRQYLRLLQNFRDRLSEQVMNLYGVPLRTTEAEITVKPPKAPDVKIGRVFDHNPELLSPLLPMGLLRGVVLRRFQRKVGYEVFKNLSRLTSQWEEIVNGAIAQLQREAERRIEDLVSTVDRLTSMPASEASSIREDLTRLDAVAREMGAAPRENR